jgi:ribosomal protein S27AE
MFMNNACPDCGSVYAVTPRDVGRRIVCTKCGVVLAIGETGIGKEASASAAATPSVSQPRKPWLTPEFRERLRSAVDWPTVLFGTGAVLVLCMAFMPSIGTAKVERRTGVMQEEQFDHELEIKKLREKPGNEERIKASEEAWGKRRPYLESEIRYAEFSNARSGYTERYGLVLGFGILTAGSLGLMRSGENLVKRIFGAAVLGILMALVFNSLLGGCGRLPGA